MQTPRSIGSGDSSVSGLSYTQNYTPDKDSQIDIRDIHAVKVVTLMSSLTSLLMLFCLTSSRSALL